MDKSVTAENGFVLNAVELKDVPTRNDTGHGHGHSHSHGQGHSHGLHTSAVTSTICGMKPVAFVVVVSDALHNFADGLAIGAGFAKSIPAGVAVSIAVICHELPHEVGMFSSIPPTAFLANLFIF